MIRIKIIFLGIKDLFVQQPHTSYLLSILVICIFLLGICWVQLSLYKNQAGWNQSHRLTDSSIQRHYEITNDSYHEETFKKALKEIGIKHQLNDNFKINLGESVHFQNDETANAFHIGDVYMRKYHDVDIFSHMVSNIKRINNSFDLNVVNHQIKELDHFSNTTDQELIKDNLMPINEYNGNYIVQLVMGHGFKINKSDNVHMLAAQSTMNLYLMHREAESFLFKARLYHHISSENKKLLRHNFLTMIPNSDRPVSFSWLSDTLKDNYEDFYKMVGSHKYRDLFYAHAINAFLRTVDYADFSRQKHALTYVDFLINLSPSFSDDIKAISLKAKVAKWCAYLFLGLMITLVYNYFKYIFKSWLVLE